MGWLRKKKKKEPTSEIESERGEELLEDLIECCDGKSNPIKFFSADDIHKATNNFSSSNLVFTGFHHKWYSGKNENHPKMLIKNFDSVTAELYCRDIAVSSMVSGHKNFLKLIGCCLEFEVPVMVYHGVENHYVLDDLSEQTWKRRMKIAQDIAIALAYLHTAFPKPFVYRAFSLEDIILDEDGIAKLSDFSFCVSIPKGETFVQVDNLAGAVDYIDEKYISSLVVSEETDVFAFGISMQKLVIGLKKFQEILLISNKLLAKREAKEEKAYGSGRRIQFRLLKFLEERRMDEIADPKMGEISEEEHCRMKAFIRLSQRCTGLRGQVPTMMEVAKELKKIQGTLINDSSSPSVEIQSDSPQDISSYSPERISFDCSAEIVSPR